MQLIRMNYFIMSDGLIISKLTPINYHSKSDCNIMQYVLIAKSERKIE